MAKLKGQKIAVVVGLFAAALHAIWALAIALGIGQWFLDFILPLHFIDSLYNVMAFNFLNAMVLIVLAFAGGYVATWLFVWIWNLIKIKN